MYMNQRIRIIGVRIEAVADGDSDYDDKVMV